MLNLEKKVDQNGSQSLGHIVSRNVITESDVVRNNDGKHFC